MSLCAGQSLGQAIAEAFQERVAAAQGLPVPTPTAAHLAEAAQQAPAQLFRDVGAPEPDAAQPVDPPAAPGTPAGPTADLRLPAGPPADLRPPAEPSADPAQPAGTREDAGPSGAQAYHPAEPVATAPGAAVLADAAEPGDPAGADPVPGMAGWMSCRTASGQLGQTDSRQVRIGMHRSASLPVCSPNCGEGQSAVKQSVQPEADWGSSKLQAVLRMSSILPLSLADAASVNWLHPRVRPGRPSDSSLAGMAGLLSCW